MREILFKGIREDNGEWLMFRSVYQFFDDNEELLAVGAVPIGTHVSEPDIVGIKKCTLSQYTGLKDKNGTRIFEGDRIARADEFEPSPEVVTWLWASWTIGASTMSDPLQDEDVAFKYVVVSNIHDAAIAAANSGEREGE